MIKVIDRFGNEKDITVDTNVQFPMAEVIEMTEARESATAVNELGNIVRKSKYNPATKTADVYNEEGDAVLTRVKDGLGVYSFDSRGREYKVYDPSMTKGSGTTTFFGTDQIKIYQGFICTLAPHLGRIYMDCKHLDINHCIIPSEWVLNKKAKYPARCTEFFEMVNKSRNHEHGYFVKKYNLFDTPVSAYDVIRLKTIFEALGLNDPDNDVLRLYGDNIPMTFKNPDETILRRRLVAWWYFLKHHTDMNEYVMSAFKDFLTKSYPDVDMASTESIIETMEKYVKF